MSVENPWMVESPAPFTSHSAAGLPGSWFSATIGLTEKTSRTSRVSRFMRGRTRGGDVRAVCTEAAGPGQATCSASEQVAACWHEPHFDAVNQLKKPMTTSGHGNKQ